jgi:(2R)-3-sulfolactate dehydrogenase (NADP+)
VFLDRIAVLAHAIEGDGDARLPGSRRLALREKAKREGVAVDADLLAEVRALAAGAARAPDWEGRPKLRKP